MPATCSYDYAIIRIVPYVERGECLNIGVILFCRTRRFLGACIHLDEKRVSAFAPQLDIRILQERLEHLLKVCYGKAESGPIAQLAQPERFHWLLSPRSTIIQTSPIHSGICTEPEAALQDLLKKLVL